MTKILYIGNNLTQRSKYNSTLTTLSDLLIDEGFKVSISSDKKNKIIRLLQMCYAVLKNRNKVDYILIDTFSTVNFYYAYCTSQLTRLFKIDYIPILHGGNLPNRIKKSPKLATSIFKHSKINVAPSEYLKQAFESKGFNVSLIPNTIEINKYNFKERLTFKPKILWVRAFDKTYNPQMAIEVINKLKKEYNDAKLCMIGPVKDDSFVQVKNLIIKYNLENTVKLTGVLPKEQWHKKATDFDIFINTTNFDNTPVSLIEIMALGLPIVSTNVGGIPFLVKHKKNGILVDKNDVDGMVKSIKDYINNVEFTKKITQNARLKAEEYDWNKVRSKWLKILS